MATESWFHGAPPPKNIKAYDEPQQEKQRSLFLQGIEYLRERLKG